MVNVPGFISDTVWTSWANQGQGELFDVVSTAFKDTFFKHADFTVTNNANEVPIGPSTNSIAPDFRMIKGLDKDPTLTTRRAIHKYNFGDRNQGGNGASFGAVYGAQDPRYRVVSRSTLLLEPPEQSNGNFRLYYVNGPIPMALPIPVITTPDDITIIPDTTFGFSVSAFLLDTGPSYFFTSDVGDTLTIAGTVSNDGVFTIASYVSGASVTVAESFTSETFPGTATVTLTRQPSVTTAGVWTFSRDNFGTISSANVGDTLVVTGAANASNNGSFPILSVDFFYIVHTATTGLVNENLGPNVVVTIQPKNTTSTAMVELEPWALEYIGQVMARKALLKEESDISGVDERIAQLRADIQTAVETDEGEQDSIFDVEQDDLGSCFPYMR